MFGARGRDPRVGSGDIRAQATHPVPLGCRWEAERRWLRRPSRRIGAIGPASQRFSIARFPMQRSITPPVGPISARHCCRETPPPWPPWPAAERIVFASIAAIDIYLDRMRLADLFLDSYPYSAGATCNDALWAGLPVLTYAGKPLSAGGREACWEPPSFRHSLRVTWPLTKRWPCGSRLDRAFCHRSSSAWLMVATLRLTCRNLPCFEAALRHMQARWTQNLSPEGFLSALRSKLRWWLTLGCFDSCESGSPVNEFTPVS